MWIGACWLEKENGGTQVLCSNACYFPPAILFFQSVFAMVGHRNAGGKMNLSVKLCTQTHAYIICALQWGNTRWLDWIILNFIMSFDFCVSFTLRDQDQINPYNLDLGLFRQHPSSRCSHTVWLANSDHFIFISTQFVPLGSIKHLFALVKGVSIW